MEGNPAGLGKRKKEKRTVAFHGPADQLQGPFDLLLQLIGKHKLDVTEIAL